MEEDHEQIHKRTIRSFVLRAGRMTAGQERAWRELWPLYGVEFEEKSLDLDALFGRSAPRMLEIGFGTGDALLAFAQQHPEIDCLGVEVHRPGVGHLMLHAHDKQLTNIRVFCHDAVEVLNECVPPNSLDVVHIYFPDPWHKKRHHKRRLIQSPFVDLLAKTMRSGGIVRLATDWQDYAQQMLEIFSKHDDFQSAKADAKRVVAAAEHRPLTRFERRGHRLGHAIWDFEFARK